MTIFPRLLFVLLLVVAPAIIWATAGGLPAQVATHFGVDGLANGWMSREGYRAFILALTVGVPLFTVVVSTLAPQATVRNSRIPHPEYWLAPTRRQETLAWMTTQACWLGSVLLTFFVGMHLVVLEASTTAPPRLPAQPFIGLVVALVIAVVVWAFALRARFRHLP